MNKRSSQHYSKGKGMEALPIRGPAALALILAAVLAPTVQQLSFETIVKMLLVLTAIAVALMDLGNWAMKVSRRKIKRTLQRIVLDDLLCSIFHPEWGLISMFVTTCLGNFTMYSLPLTTKQRVQLMQHALDGTLVSNHQTVTKTCDAERILRSPGGITELLPESFQSWLQNEDEVTDVIIHNNSKDCHDQLHNDIVDNLSPVLSSQTEPEGVNITLLSDFNSEDGDNSSVISEECPPSSTHQQKKSLQQTQKTKSQHPIPSSMDIVRSVMTDVTASQMKSILGYLPSHSLQATSLAAVALLSAQFRYSKRSREIVWTILHASVSLTGSAVLVGSLLALLAQHQLQQQSSQGRPSTSSISKPFNFHLWKVLDKFSFGKIQFAGQTMKNIMKLLRQSEHARKMQGIIAMLVLAYFGRRRIRSTN